VSPDSWEHALNYSLYIVSDTNKHFKFDSDRNKRFINIKVREWIPPIGPLTKEILLKLFLDTVPSSSEEAFRAMRGQQAEARRNVSIPFQNRDGFWTLGRLFGRPGFRLFRAHLAVLFMRF